MYKQLNDPDEVIKVAVNYLATELPIPNDLKDKLKELGIWDVFNAGTINISTDI